MRLQKMKMPKKYKNKYRTTSHRKPNWDYSSDGAYFLTICTQHRSRNLGEITDGKMTLSNFGKIVDDEWQKSFEIRDELFCDEYIIMPDHMHAIVVLKNDSGDPPESAVNLHGRAILPPSPAFYRLPKSISSFLAGFKSAVNSKIDDYIDDNKLKIPKYNRKNHFFQPNYHDSIIHDDQSFQRVKNYIIANPKNW